MRKYSNYEIENLQDSWTMLYMCLGKAVVKTGISGEAALRNAIRMYGRFRGEQLRNKHLKYGLKINLYNLFTYGDLPSDPRFRREKLKLTPQERISNTLVCPMADLWKAYGEKELGRIYCEEFHHAKFSAYAPKVQVNLSKTLTQGDDKLCSFAIYLRPANMDEDERKKSFEEHSDISERVKNDYPLNSYREGYGYLSYWLYFFICKAVYNSMGQYGLEIVSAGLEEYAEIVVQYILNKNKELEKNAEDILPFNLSFDKSNVEKYFDKDSEIYKIYLNNFIEICKTCLK